MTQALKELQAEIVVEPQDEGHDCGSIMTTRFSIAEYETAGPLDAFGTVLAHSRQDHFQFCGCPRIKAF